MKINVNNIGPIMTVGASRQFPRDPRPEIALSGRSNVGKSSLINTLLGRKSLARVSSSPGKTITINYYDIDKKMYLVDLPGYGYAKRNLENKQVWSGLTDGYFTQNKNIDLLSLVVQLVDCKVGITNDDAMMIDFLNQMEIPYIIVATKVDKLNKTDRNTQLAKISGDEILKEGTLVIPFSSHTGEGKTELLKEIFKYTNL